MDESATIGPVDGTKVSRYAGSPAFAPLPRVDEVLRCDVAILGVPFNGRISFRPGARFGPSTIRPASRHPGPTFHPDLWVSLFPVKKVGDAGDVPCTPFDIDEALQQIADPAREAIEREQKFVADAGFGSSGIRADDFDRLGAAAVADQTTSRMAGGALSAPGAQS